jgi:hypothetical protein
MTTTTVTTPAHALVGKRALNETLAVYSGLTSEMIPHSGDVEAAATREEAEARALHSMRILLGELADEAKFPRKSSCARRLLMINMGSGYLYLLGDPDDPKTWPLKSLWPLGGSAQFPLCMNMLAHCVRRAVNALPSIASKECVSKEGMNRVYGLAHAIIITSKLVEWAVKSVERFSPSAPIEAIPSPAPVPEPEMECGCEECGDCKDCGACVEGEDL